jgi:hypothetical protein
MADALRGKASPEAAQFLETMLPGTGRNDWGTVLRSAEDAKGVADNMAEIAQWEKIKATDPNVVTPVNPIADKMVSLAKTSLDSAKKAAVDNYGKAMNALEESGAIEGSYVSAQQPAIQFEAQLKSLGLLEKAADGSMRIVTKPSAQTQEIMQVFDPKSVNQLNKVYTQLKSVLTPGEAFKGEIAGRAERKLSFEDTKKLLSGIDDILESTGFYKGGEAAMSNNARRALTQLRGNLAESMASSLEGKGVLLDGELYSAKDFFKEQVQGKYHEFRNLYDNFAIPKTLGGTDQRASDTIMKMFGAKGEFLERDFGKMLELAGLKPEQVLPKLQQHRAAINLSDIYTSSKGVGALAKTAFGMGSPRAIAETLSERVAQRTTESLQKVQGIQPVTNTMLHSVARGATWINSLSTTDRINLITNPELMKQFGTSVLQAPLLHQQKASQLMNQVQGPPQ